LIARGRELADLDNALLQARRGRASAVLLRGEPGTGKTATIEATIARAIDFRVVELSGKDLPASPSEPCSWPRPLIDLLGEASLWDDTDGNGSHETAVQRAHEALAEVAERSLLPLLVAIDDAQELPARFTVALLAAATREMSEESLALFVAEQTCPHEPPGELGAAGVSDHRLRGLTVHQARDLFSLQQFPQPVRPVLEMLHHSTGGNPAALIDVHGRIGPDVVGGWRPVPEPLPVSRAIAAAFGRCLGRFEDDVCNALAAAATASLPLALLERVLDGLGLSRRALDPAARAGIIEVRSKRVQFAHPMVRIAAYQLAPAELRAALHEAVCDVYWDEGEIELSAFHAGQAAPRRSRRLARLYGEAAHAALDRADARSAASHHEMAAELGESDDVNAQRLARAAAGWLSVGEAARSLVCLERAERLEAAPLTAAELRYQRARVDMASSCEAHIADEMLAAAAVMEREEPGRAVLMISDAAACVAMGGAFEQAVAIAEETRRLQPVAGTQSAGVAVAGRAALSHLAGLDTEAVNELVPAALLLVGQAHSFPASPQLAFLIGQALVELDPRQAMRFASWAERCSNAIGDKALQSVPMSLQAGVALRLGHLEEAEMSASSALAAADACHQEALSLQALTLLVETLAAKGSYSPAFQYASRLLGAASEQDFRLRARTYTALAALDLQRRRTRSALAWLRAAESESAPAELERPPADPYSLAWRPALAEVMAVEGRVGEIADLVGPPQRPGGDAGTDGAVGTMRDARIAYVRGLAAPDLAEAGTHFRAALAVGPTMPMLAARVEMGWGMRAAQLGSLTEAAEHLDLAIDRFESMGASGWAQFTEVELEQLLPRLEVGPAGNLTARASQSTSDNSHGSDDRSDAGSDESTSTWGITMLGSFSVRRNGLVVPNPPSLTTQALKIVALRGRVLAEELAELLWPGSAPGIGVRRLRNVLWRIRASCGDVLLRDENFILLAPEVLTDVARMRELAQAARDGSTVREKAAELAREALRLYQGELLPGDRYVDWPTSARESLARLQVQLLELLVTIAVESERPQDALVLLEELTESDPYEERHYVRAGELYLRLGSPARAMSTVSRAERMLQDLGMVPSHALRGLRGELTAS
jgi:DNA-binding SARP family transcriptional activator